jgi:hypothetical protein
MLIPQSCFLLPSASQGVAINFVKNDDIKILRDIEQFYSTQIGEALWVCVGWVWVGGECARALGEAAA